MALSQASNSLFTASSILTGVAIFLRQPIGNATRHESIELNQQANEAAKKAAEKQEDPDINAASPRKIADSLASLEKRQGGRNNSGNTIQSQRTQRVSDETSDSKAKKVGKNLGSISVQSTLY
ncbi:hypothetical protein CROQUDRAFT_91725 [Cronartium quercuum f. sp. fusiforme G11]|uniref:Uncharacterized protein n=1 Tax=Cronartium quercuum f. sp. fusiforme G11 TaxID=708437 RepID=A0A9P6NJT6_9BASI|nr:hypothetical protein CROQUDRAFT_91725 [Cronartium quercuum f. sp. fusiforme G11]